MYSDDLGGSVSYASGACEGGRLSPDTAGMEIVTAVVVQYHLV
ncbi:MAG: hypothetical protein ACXVIU_03495 [Halobacteriota archaeon]